MPTHRYNKKIVKAICDLIKKDTYTIVEICANVGISDRCFYDWQKNNAEFADAIAQARIDANMKFLKAARNSLIKKLEGYEVEETKVVATNDILGKPKIKEKTITKKHFQPDTAAIIFALTNLEGETWKNRQNTELTGKDGKDLIQSKSDDELDSRIAELEKKLGK